jgi:hypothetical protein
MIIACHATAEQLNAVGKSISTLGYDVEGTPESLEWVRKQLLAEQARLRASFTGAVKIQAGVASCQVDPLDLGEKSGVALFKLDPTDGLCEISAHCDVTAGLMGSTPPGAAPTCTTDQAKMKGLKTYGLSWSPSAGSPAEHVASSSTAEKHSFWYRIPALFDAWITDTTRAGAAPIAARQVAIPQGGALLALPMMGGRGAANADIAIDPATGMLTSLTLGGKAVDLGASAGAVTSFIDTMTGLDTVADSSEAERLTAEKDAIQAQIDLLRAQEELAKLLSGEESP